jgi:hypothetical protein
MHKDVFVVPGGNTTQLQVLDVVMNITVTDHQKQLCSEWLLTEDLASTPAGRIKKPNMTLLCQRLIMASQPISPELIVKGFKKCFISSVMGGTDDDLLWNDSEEDGNVGSECEKI